MTWIILLEMIGIACSPAVIFAANLFLESAVLIVLGLLISRLIKAKGAALQSSDEVHLNRLFHYSTRKTVKGFKLGCRDAAVC